MRQLVPLIETVLGLRQRKQIDSCNVQRRLFPLLPDLPTLYAEWRRLVVTYGVSGVQVHDARLVAAILSHGATHILTFNTADFARYAPEGIVAVDPKTV